MKCTNKKELSPRELRHLKENKHSDKTVIKFIVLVVLLVVLIIVLACVLFIKEPEAALTRPFDRDDVTFGVQKSEERAVNHAVPFTDGLCVTAGNVSLGGVNITSDAGALFDLTQDEVIYAQGVHEKLYPASLTKIMTALVALKYGNLDDMIKVNENAINVDPESSLCYLQLGDQYSLRQLLYGLLIASGNDAGVAIAEHVGGSLENFVQMMNEESMLIGATNTHYTNPHGLQDENHYTTAYDVYLTLQEAMKYDEFQDIINQKSYVAKFKLEDGTEVERVWDATNHYFTNDAQAPEGVTVFGGKTGTTNEAGACLALISKDLYGNPFYSVIMGAPSKEVLYNEMTVLLSKINK